MVEKNHGVEMSRELQSALQAAQIKNDRKDTWGNAADAFMFIPSKSCARAIEDANVNSIDLEEGEEQTQSPGINKSGINHIKQTQ